MKKLTDSKGFTLIELLVIIAIFGAMMGVVAIGGNTLQKHRLKQASKELCADLLSLRQQAVTTRTDNQCRGFGLRFVTADKYVMFEFKDNVTENYQYDGVGEERAGSQQEKSLPKGVTATISGGDPTGTVRIFDNQGMLRRPDWDSIGLSILLSVPQDSATRSVILSGLQIREVAN